MLNVLDRILEATGRWPLRESENIVDEIYRARSLQPGAVPARLSKESRLLKDYLLYSGKAYDQEAIEEDDAEKFETYLTHTIRRVRSGDVDDYLHYLIEPGWSGYSQARAEILTFILGAFPGRSQEVITRLISLGRGQYLAYLVSQKGLGRLMTPQRRQQTEEILLSQPEALWVLFRNPQGWYNLFPRLRLVIEQGLTPQVAGLTALLGPNLAKYVQLRL